MYVKPTETKAAEAKNCENLQACKTLLMEKMEKKDLTVREIKALCIEEQSQSLGTALDALRELQNDGQIERMYKNFGKGRMVVCYQKTKAPAEERVVHKGHISMAEVYNQTVLKTLAAAPEPLSKSEIAAAGSLNKKTCEAALNRLQRAKAVAVEGAIRHTAKRLYSIPVYRVIAEYQPEKKKTPKPLVHEATVLAVLGKAKSPLSKKEIAKAGKIGPGTCGFALASLKKAKAIVCTQMPRNFSGHWYMVHVYQLTSDSIPVTIPAPGERVLAVLAKMKTPVTAEEISKTLIPPRSVNFVNVEIRELLSQNKVERVQNFAGTKHLFQIARDEKAAPLQSTEERLLNLLKTHGEMTSADAAPLLGKSLSYTRKCLRDLVNEGKVGVSSTVSKTTRRPWMVYTLKTLGTSKKRTDKIAPLAILKQQPLPFGRSAKMSLLEETIVLALTNKPTTPIELYNRFPKGIWKDVWAAVDSLLAAGKIEKINGELDAEALFAIPSRDKSKTTKATKPIKTVARSTDAKEPAPLAADKAALEAMVWLVIRSEGPISLEGLYDRFSKQTCPEIWAAMGKLIAEGRITKIDAPDGEYSEYTGSFYIATEKPLAPAVEEAKPKTKNPTLVEILKDAVRKDYAGQAMTFTDLAWKFRKESPTALLAAINEMEAEGGLEKVKDGAPGAKEVLLYIRKRAMAPTLTPEKTRLLELIDARFKEIEKSMKEIVAAVVDNTLAN